MPWEELRAAIEELRVLLEGLRGRGGLRHGLSYARVSDIVEQVKCEARLDALLGVERRVDERLREVALLAEIALEARRRLPEHPPPAMILSLPVAGVVAGVPIVGRPRGVAVREGRVEAIVHAGVSARPQRFYESDRVRAYAYCAALLSSPLPRSPAPVYVHVKASTREALAEALSLVRRQLLEAHRPEPLASTDAAVHIVACGEHAVEALEPLLGYWLGLREPRRRPGPWCNECPLEACPHHPSNR